MDHQGRSTFALVNTHDRIFGPHRVPSPVRQSNLHTPAEPALSTAAYTFPSASSAYEVFAEVPDWDLTPEDYSVDHFGILGLGRRCSKVPGHGR